MLTILISAGVAYGFWVACRRAEGGERGAAWLARALAATSLVACALLCLLGLWLALYACDESCDARRSSDWTGNRDAWQWTAQLPIVVLGSICVLVGLGLSFARRHRAARLTLSAGAMLISAWAILLMPINPQVL